MLDRSARHLEITSRVQIPAAVEPSECSHLMLRPRWEADGYLCDGCFQPFTAEEAEQLCSETLIRVPHVDS